MASVSGGSRLMMRQRPQSQQHEDHDQWYNDERTRTQQPTTASTNNVARACGVSAAAASKSKVEVVVDPLSNEEYNKLKQLGHFFPSQSPTYEDEEDDEEDEDDEENEDDEEDEDDEEKSQEEKEEETLETSDTEPNNKEEEEVDPLSSYQYYKLKTLGHLFPTSDADDDNDGSEDEDEEENNDEETTLQTSHSQQEQKVTYREDAAAKDDDDDDESVEEKEDEVPSQSSSDGDDDSNDDDYRKEKRDEDKSQQKEGLSHAADDNDDNNIREHYRDEDVVPLTTKEYFKLKELGHLFPSSESSASEDDDSEAEEEERSSLLQSQLQSQQEEVNNDHSDAYAAAVHDDEEDEDEESYPLRREEYFKLKELGHLFPQSSSSDDDDDDNNQDSDDEDDVPIKQHLRRKRCTLMKQTQSAEQKMKNRHDVPNRRVLRSSNNNNKRKRGSSLLDSFKLTVTKKKSRHRNDDGERNKIYSNYNDDDVGSTTHDEDSSSDEGYDDNDDNYSHDEEKEEIDEDNDDSEDDESFDEDDSAASSVRPKTCAASAIAKKKTKQTQKKRRRKKSKIKKKKTTNVDIVWNERLMELKDYYDEYGTWQVDEKIDNSLAQWTQKLRRRYLAFIQQEQNQDQQEEQTNASKNENENEDQQQQEGNDNDDELHDSNRTTTATATATTTTTSFKHKTTITKNSKEILSLEQYEQLCEMGYEYTCHRREVDDQIWKERYDEVYDHYQIYKNWTPPNAKLRRWIKVQKCAYRNKMLNKSRQTLRDDRHIQLLHIGFPFPTIDVEAVEARIKEGKSHFETRWDNNLNALVDYHNQHGTWDVDTEYNHDLKEWERRIRVQYKNRIQSQTNPNHKCRQRDMLTDERYERLCDVGFEFPPVPGENNNVKYRKRHGERIWNTLRNKTWEERLMELYDYHEEYGTWNVNEGLNKDLYSWERTLRQQYRNRIRTMQQQQRTKENNNDETDYSSQNSNNDNDDDDDKEEEALSSASKTTNHQRRKGQRKKKIHMLSHERYEQLCQIGYEVPSVQQNPSSNQTKEDRFDSYIDLYVEYKSKYELLRSKYHHKYNSAPTKWCVDRHVEEGKYENLAKWMLKQRSAYMNRIDQQYQRGPFAARGSSQQQRNINPLPLSDERYHKLCHVNFIFPDLHYMNYFKNNSKDKHPDEESYDEENYD